MANTPKDRKAQSSWEADSDRYLQKKKQHPNITAIRESMGNKKVRTT